MMRQYELNDFQDVNDFLTKMAVKLGCLKKGGLPDTHKAAQRVLSDWTHGKLTYFTEPPERTHDIISTELVTQMQEAFDIDALLNNEEEQFEDLEDESSSYSCDDETMSEDAHSIVEAMDDDCDHHSEATKVQFKVQIADQSKRLSKRQHADKVDRQYDEEIRREIKKSNLTRQQEFKKMKKHQKKSGTLSIYLFFCFQKKLLFN